MKKRFLSYLIVLTMVFSLLSAFSLTSNAAEINSTTNKYTYIRMAPYWTAEVVDELTSGYSITILEREYTYLYVQYTKNSVVKRGYMPKADTGATGYSWCQHNEYNSGYNKTSAVQTVYYRPGGASCGTIDANEGEVSNKPLLVLHVANGYAFIQYVTNTTNTGSSHVLFKRGWVPTSIIGYTHSTYPAGINQNRYYYIKNVATEKYLDLESYSAGNVNGGNIHIWDFHGSYNQEWKLLEIPSGSSKYVKLATNQGTQNRVIRIAEATAVVGNNVELYTQGNPSKDQEFLIERFPDPSDEENPYYYTIKARCGSNYMVLGVNPGDSGTGGDVYLRYPDGSDYNKWKIEEAYVEDEDYTYSELGKISSDISNGINAKYNIADICKTKTINSISVSFEGATRNVFNSWNRSNTKITLSADSTSINVITWKDDVKKEWVPDEGDYSYTFGSTSGVDSYGSRDIIMYFGSIKEYGENNDYTTSDVVSHWKSTLAHELGHTLGLGHSPSGVPYSIMSYDRDRTEVREPHNVDIATAKKNYCSK